MKLNAFTIQLCFLTLTITESFLTPTPSTRVQKTPPALQQSKSTSAIPTNEKSLVEPIQDDSYSKNPVKRIKHFLTTLKGNDEQAIVHDKSLRETGGVWKTTFLAKPAYGVSAYLPEITTELTKEEAKGNLKGKWPQSVIDVLGHSSLIAADLDTEEFVTARKIFMESMSTTSILSQSLPGIEEAIENTLNHWKQCAETGESTTFSEDVSAITYSVIATAVFGPKSLTDEDMSVLRSCTDTIAKGLFSFPIDFPVLRNMPFFRRYARAMRARQEMRELLIQKIGLRRLAMQSAASVGAEFQPNGMLDAFVLRGGELGEEKLLDFCVDNVILSIFAGYDTTASISTNLILILLKYASAEELAQIRSELEHFDIRSTSITKSSGGVLDAVPSLKSAIYESFRFRPVVAATFRQTTKPIVLGKVEVPADTTILWSHLYGNESPALFQSGTGACPLRFLNTNEPPPFIFGYGKHKCPGQFLAQIEIVLVMKAFLNNFDFELKGDQDTNPTVPFNTPKSGLKLALATRA